MSSRVLCLRSLFLIIYICNCKKKRDGCHQALRMCGGDEDELRSKFIVTNLKRVNTGYQLNSDVLPFDTYQLFRESRRSFILILGALYFVLSSAVFTLLAWGAGCLELDVTPGNFLPMGFLILSGVGGDGGFNGSETVCLWIHTVAIFVGVYVTLPVIGAIVLVRRTSRTMYRISLSHSLRSFSTIHSRRYGCWTIRRTSYFAPTWCCSPCGTACPRSR